MKSEVILDTNIAEAREAFFKSLYESAFPSVARFVSSRKGSLQDAKDIFHDALVIYYEKVADNTFQPDVSEEAYIMGIVKHLWLKKFRTDSSLVILNEWESNLEIPDDTAPTVEENKLLTFLESAGKKCLELLSAFYFDKMNMDLIASTFGYGTAHSATVQKFKCLEKVRETVKQKSVQYEDFME